MREGGPAEILHEHADPCRGARELRVGRHRARLGEWQRDALRQGDEKARSKECERGHMPGREEAGLGDDGGEHHDRAREHHRLIGHPAAQSRGDEIANQKANRKHQKIDAELGRGAVQKLFHQSRGGCRRDQESTGGEAALQHECSEAQVAEQLGITSRHTHRLAPGLTGWPRFEHGEIASDQDDASDQQREAEHAAPSQRVDQHAPDQRRDHRADGIEHREIGDHLDQPCRSIDVSGDRAREGDACLLYTSRCV